MIVEECWIYMIVAVHIFELFCIWVATKEDKVGSAEVGVIMQGLGLDDSATTGGCGRQMVDKRGMGVGRCVRATPSFPKRFKKLGQVAVAASWKEGILRTTLGVVLDGIIESSAGSGGAAIGVSLA